MRLIDGDALYDEVRGGQLSALGFEGYDDYTNINNIDDALDAIKYAPTVSQWIPCSRELPKQQKKVLIQDGNDITIGYLNGENRWRDLTNLDDYLKAVIAWMPLPEPYEGADT